jgi:hypothetical protein
MHPACSGVLRIILHFVTEFLSNDVLNVVTRGELGHWTLPTLIHAFIRQIENILGEHPLWRAEFSNYTPNEDNGRPLTSRQEQQLRAQDAAWETSCDELESFIFRKIGAVLLPSKGTVEPNRAESSSPNPLPGAPPPLGRPSWGGGYGHGGTGSRAEKSIDVFDRLHALKWISSSDLGVAWSGLDSPSTWQPAAKELRDLASCQAPLEMVSCLVRCFAHVSQVLVTLLEESKAREKQIKNLKTSKPSTSPIRQALLTASSFVENQERASLSADMQRLSLLRTTSGEDELGARVSLAASSRWSLESKDIGVSGMSNLPCADDVLPAVILVLLQSNPRHILAYLDFALAFRNQQRLSSEGHYFIVTVTSAVHFLLDIQPDQLGLTESEFAERSLESQKNSSSAASVDEALDGGEIELFHIEGILEDGN